MLRSLRAGENLHIVFWLMKDLCWVSDFKLLGMIMIVPTLAMAIWIAWRSREDIGELLHSLAVVFWIMANGTWMTGEFFYNDGTRPIAIGFFIAGLLTLLPYYGYVLPRKRVKSES
ncbi:MAG TPA: hypothetical protein PK760_10935, partial [Flavobacteriales bacterium]|nr:hypothetical protein [Flavobacteriales bacterium]